MVSHRDYQSRKAANLKLVRHTLGICNSLEERKKLLKGDVGGGLLATCLSDNPPHPHPNTAQIHRFFFDPLLLPCPSTLSNLTLNSNNLGTCRASAVQECISLYMCPIFWKPLNPDSSSTQGISHRGRGEESGERGKDAELRSRASG